MEPETTAHPVLDILNTQFHKYVSGTYHINSLDSYNYSIYGQGAQQNAIAVLHTLMFTVCLTEYDAKVNSVKFVVSDDGS